MEESKTNDFVTNLTINVQMGQDSIFYTWGWQGLYVHFTCKLHVHKDACTHTGPIVLISKIKKLRRVSLSLVSLSPPTACLSSKKTLATCLLQLKRTSVGSCLDKLVTFRHLAALSNSHFIFLCLSLLYSVRSPSLFAVSPLCAS